MTILLTTACSDATTASNDPVPDAGFDAPQQLACDVGAKTGDPAGATGKKTARGTSFNVRVPADYDPTAAHPLLVVYAPAGADAKTTEQFTGLTPDATARGYLIAYADHVTPNDTAAMNDVATVPSLVADAWCIDPARIYLTGHSDGASIVSILALSGKTHAAAYAPSASGTNGQYLDAAGCPKSPTSVMVLHSRDDELFPGFGAQAATFWANCAKCQRGEPLANGCVPYQGCEGGVEVQYCEGTGAHGVWPKKNAAMLDFFERFTLPEAP